MVPPGPGLVGVTFQKGQILKAEVQWARVLSVFVADWRGETTILRAF